MSEHETNCIEVIHGIYAHRLPLVGRTVSQIRHQVTYPLHIAPDAVSFVDGKEVDEETVLAAGQVLNFVVHRGEMG